MRERKEGNVGKKVACYGFLEDDKTADSSANYNSLNYD